MDYARDKEIKAGRRVKNSRKQAPGVKVPKLGRPNNSTNYSRSLSSADTTQESLLDDMDEEGNLSSYEQETSEPIKSVAFFPALKEASVTSVVPLRKTSSVTQSKTTGENTLERMKRLQREKIASSSLAGFV